MQFTPKSEEELNSPTYPSGEYGFRVIEAEETVSKAGNPMIKVKLEIQKGHLSPLYINDYLLTESHFKLYSFCKSIGKKELYESGRISPFDLKEKSGHAKFDFEEYNGKKYLKAKAYIAKENQTASGVVVHEDDALDDEIPF